MKKKIFAAVLSAALISTCAYAQDWQRSQLKGGCNPVEYGGDIVLHDGSGAGLGEYSDEIGYYEQLFAGSFTLSAKILESEKTYTGFMLRSGVNGDDACIYFGLDSMGRYQVLQRSDDGGKLAKRYTDEKFSQMDYKYFKMIRDAENSLVILRASLDGAEYETVATVECDMPSEAHIGFTSGFKSVYGGVSFTEGAESYPQGSEAVTAVIASPSYGSIEVEIQMNAYTSGYDLYRSKNGGEYELIASGEGAALYVDKALEEGEYRYKSVPVAGGEGAESQPVRIAHTLSLSDEWTVLEIGKADGRGMEYVNADGDIVLTTSGLGQQVLYYNSDSELFAAVKASGDGDYIVRMTERGETDNAWAKVGLQLRASEDANSVHLSAVNITEPNTGTYFITRSETGGETSQTRVLDYEAEYLRITVKDGVASVYAGSDGENWNALGSAELTDEEYLIGVFNADESAASRRVCFGPVLFPAKAAGLETDNGFRVLHGNTLLSGDFRIYGDRIYVPAELIEKSLDVSADELPVKPDENGCVPLRETVEALGGTVNWYDDTRTAGFEM
ncbi:MAG: hypothetical protein ACI4SS_01365 [Clostridia bacterium]